MIPFFRKIRKKMADDNRPLKYMRYAIGEIVLVVIGILIALQINNWNEENKRKAIAKSFLIEILKDTQIDKIQLNEVIQTQIKSLNALEWCIDHLGNSQFSKDSLALIYAKAIRRNYTFFPHDGAYLSLLSIGGVNLIRNQNVSTEITNLYEHGYERLLYNGDVLDRRVDNILLGTQNYFIPEIGLFTIEEVKSSPMMAHLYYLLRGKKVYIERAELTMEAIEKIEELIKTEIEQ